MDADHDEIDVETLWLREPGREEEASDALRVLARGRVISSPAEICMIAEAVFAKGAERATGRALLWIAATLGSRRAASLLAGEIEALIETTDSDPDRRRMVNLASKWRKNSTLLKFHDLSKLARDDYDDSGLLEDAVEAVSERVSRKAPGMMVVREIGERDTADGGSLQRRYRNVIANEFVIRSFLPSVGAFSNELAAQWPWASDLASRLDKKVALARSLGLDHVVFAPLLLVGPPGIGKTSIAKSIVEILRVPSVVIDASTPSDGNPLAAVPREWHGHRPCAPILAMQRESCANPAIILDDLDKASLLGRPGKIEMTAASMIGDPHRFYDACLMAECDLSSVTFIATVTHPDRLLSSTRDRFEVVRIPPPQLSHLPGLVASIISREAVRLGTRPEMLPSLPPEAMSALASLLRRGGSIRSMTQLYRRFLETLAEADASPAVVH